MPRFVVLRHDKESGAHFDLMLEHEGALLTFSFAAFPQPGSAGERLADHRLAYLDLEGDIGPPLVPRGLASRPEGTRGPRGRVPEGGKGRVARVESGSFDMIGVDENAVFVFLRGERLRGNARLVRESNDAWRLKGE